MKFDKERMIGKKILVGIVYTDESGKPDRLVMNHGVIMGVEGNAVKYKLHAGDQTVTIPYNPSFFEESDPEAVYTLAETGEEVTGVEIVAKFEVRPPKNAEA